MTTKTCAMCPRRARWHLEADGLEELYACNIHLVELRNQFELLLSVDDSNPQTQIDRAMELIQKQNAAQNPLDAIHKPRPE